MKIKSVPYPRLRMEGQVVPPQALLHQCQRHPVREGDAMGSFRFHGWLVVEIETDDGLVGIGNCALAPRVAKKSSTSTWRRSASAKTRSTTGTSGRRCIAAPRLGPQGHRHAISAVDLAIWDIMGKAVNKPVFKLLGGRTKGDLDLRLEALRQRQPRRLPRRGQAT